MTPKTPPPLTDVHADDAPDLSAAEWRDRFAKALQASAPLEGGDLERPLKFGRAVHLVDEGTPLQSEEDYQAALREIEQYFREEPRPGTPEAMRFDQLAREISLYESVHWPVSAPDSDT